MQRWIVDIPVGTVFILIAFNLSAFCLMGMRWYYLLRLDKIDISFLTLTFSRLVGFAWSYITPGSQMGGEIFQAKYAASAKLSLGASAVTLLQDRVIELIGNILVIIFILSFYYLGITGLISVLIINLIISAILIFKSDLSDIHLESILLRLTLLFFKKKHRFYSTHKRIKKFKIPVLTWPESSFVRLLLLLSIWITPGIALLELFIFFNLTGYSLNMLEALILLSTIKISFYIPVPGAMGFFEAGVLWACHLLNIPEVAGLGFVFYSRIRDSIQVSFGLIISVKSKSKRLDQS